MGHLVELDTPLSARTIRWPTKADRPQRGSRQNGRRNEPKRGGFPNYGNARKFEPSQAGAAAATGDRSRSVKTPRKNRATLRQEAAEARFMELQMLATRDAAVSAHPEVNRLGV
jgi:hypothetical protein